MYGHNILSDIYCECGSRMYINIFSEQLAMCRKCYLTYDKETGEFF